ncbi:hypothetical protein QSV34_04475 [Porticoccus sp. W117]|uniref:hypothetical protein n=1 Tax=Porticoccus sp. W117 TaxID=3054777 RepID=UPI0025985644|nr:hypothetical protein [Porticoccus sp. W117]MDM3870600.1 hypothetical protein [Porticoccus sp. W117]
MKKNQITLILLPSILLATNASANRLDIELGLETAYTNNANFSFSNKLSERQDRLTARATGKYKNTWLSSDIDYRISQLLFNKDSQDNRIELDGTANILLGAENGRFNVAINNSKRQVLGNASETPSADNQQTRDVTSILPRFNIIQNQADQLSIAGIYSAVNFDQNQSTQDSFDSTSTGVELLYSRNISRVDTISAVIQQLEVEYDDISVEYDYQSALLRYSTDLRQLDYSIAIGYNSVDPSIGPKDNAIQWELSAAFDNGVHQVTFLSESYLTDPSRGNQNSILQDGLDQVALGNGFTAIVDQYNRTAHTLSYSTSSLCKLCNVSFTISASEEEYNVQTQEDNDELFITLGGSYQLSRSSEIGISLSRQEATYEPGSTLSSFDADIVSLHYNKELNRNLDISFLISQNERTGSTTQDSFDEKRAVLGITYRIN